MFCVHRFSPGFQSFLPLHTGFPAPPPAPGLSIALDPTGKPGAEGLPWAWSGARPGRGRWRV